MFAVMALSLGGASSAERAFDLCSTAENAEQGISQNDLLLPGPPSPDEIPQNMTPSGKPNCEPYAYLSALLIGDFANLDNRAEGEYLDLAVLHGTGKCSSGQAQVCSTAFGVSPRLGIQFTLVGAKPSGTS